MKSIFIYGLSGSGKDTISNFLRDNHNYLKLRCAQTIKQVITEKLNITFDELEEQKRLNPELRSLHWETGKILSENSEGGDAAMNRLQQIIDRTSMDFQILPQSITDNPIVVCDARRECEIEILLKEGFEGIFLTRRPNEFRGDGSHATEQYHFTNGVFHKFQEMYPSQCHTISNNFNNISDNIQDASVLKLNNYSQCHSSDGTNYDLFRIVSDKILCLDACDC